MRSESVCSSGVDIMKYDVKRQETTYVSCNLQEYLNTFINLVNCDGDEIKGIYKGESAKFRHEICSE